MKNGIDYLSNVCLDAARTLEHAAGNNSIQYACYDVDCLNLSDTYLRSDIRKAEWFKPIYESRSGATIYAIEILDGPSNNRLLDLYRRYIMMPIGERRGTSALKSTVDTDTSYLYVGKVKALFYGRVIQHLGYHSASQTVGLQLHHWLSGEYLKLRFHTYHFDSNMEDCLEVLESRMAKELKPLIGKHR